MVTLIGPRCGKREDPATGSCRLCSLRVVAAEARLPLNPKAGMIGKQTGGSWGAVS